MKILRLIFFSFILLFLCNLTGSAQGNYSFSFTYDASGNRLTRTRTIILLKSAKIENQDSLSNHPKSFEDLIGNRPIKIYPNPTKGLLKVEIPVADEVSAKLKIYSSQGSVIKDIPVTGTFTEIDLSNQSPGIFILRIYIGELSSEWKIIKE